MKPTAYVLFFVSVLLAVTGLLVFRSSSPNASGTDGADGGPWTSSALMVVLLAAAAGAAAVAWAMLRYGGKGYTETNSPQRR